MRVRMIHSSYGRGVLTDESGEMRFELDPEELGHYHTRDLEDGRLTAARSRPGYLHRDPAESYTPEEEAWVSDLIIASGVDRAPDWYGRHFGFGATWKTDSQLAEIERSRGARVFLNRR